MNRYLAVGLGLLWCTFAPSVWPMSQQEERLAVPLKDLPPLVQKALQKDYSAWIPISAARLERNDYIHYFVQLRMAGQETRTVEVLENGELVTSSAKP